MEISINIGPYGGENYKMLLLQQLWFFLNKPFFSECSLWQHLQKIIYWDFEFQIFCLKWSDIWDSGVVVTCIWGTFATLRLVFIKVHFCSFRKFALWFAAVS